VKEKDSYESEIVCQDEDEDGSIEFWNLEGTGLVITSRFNDVEMVTHDKECCICLTRENMENLAVWLGERLKQK